MTAYRMIDCKQVYVTDGWDTILGNEWNPSTTNTPNGTLLYLSPKVAQSDIQPLRNLAPNAVGEIILEATNGSEVTWLHLLYRNGNVQEISTPAHQWNV